MSTKAAAPKPKDFEVDSARWSADKKTARQRLGYPLSDDKVDCTGDPVLVEASHAADLDINNIIKRYSPQDLEDSAAAVQAGFADFTKIDDLHTMMNKVASAGEAFMELPAQLRTRFNNDPAQLWDAILKSEKDPVLKKELQDLHVLKKPLQGGPVESQEPPKPAAESKGGTSTT